MLILEHDPEQHSKGFNRQSDTLDNANAGGTFKPYTITQKVLNEKIFYY